MRLRFLLDENMDRAIQRQLQRLNSEIEVKSEKVNLLKGDRDKLESEKNRIKYERETLEREKQISRERKNYNNYLEQMKQEKKRMKQGVK